MAEKNEREIKFGHFYFFLFVAFILGGIITKRIFHHPEFMMLWHLPAAVFLVLAGRLYTREQRQRYYKASITKHKAQE